MNFSENFYIYLVVDTSKGRRYLYYSSANSDRGMQSSGRSIHHGLGSESKDGTWHTYTRNLQADLQAFEPDNELLTVNGFLVRGSGRVDDIGTPGYYNGIYNIKEDAEIKKKTIKYFQNANNQRTGKLITNLWVEKYLWKDRTTLLAVYNNTYARGDYIKQRFEYADSRLPVAMTDENGTKYYLHYDQVGSLRAISDTSQHIVKEITYDTYGNILTDTNSSFTIPFGFAGGLYDVDTKLTRFGYRDYDAYTGKWTAKDPIGFDGGDSNLYGYVLGDPVNFIDSTGLYTCNGSSNPIWHKQEEGGSTWLNPGKCAPSDGYKPKGWGGDWKKTTGGSFCYITDDYMYDWGTTKWLWENKYMKDPPGRKGKCHSNWGCESK